MRPIRLFPSLFVLAAVFFSLLLGGCHETILQSLWLKPAFVTEGTPDWPSIPTYRFEKIGAAVTVINDSADFYIRLTSYDHGLAGRLRGQGLTVWLSDEKSGSNRLGIRYPIGMVGRKPDDLSSRFMPNADIPPSAMMDMMALQDNVIELISQDSALNGRTTLDEVAQHGVHPAVTDAGGIFVYSLHFAVGGDVSWIRPGARLVVELKSDAIKMGRVGDHEMKRPKPEGRGDHGGMPPMGGGRPPGGRRGGPPDHDGKSDRDGGLRPDEPLDLKFIVEIATTDLTTP